MRKINKKILLPIFLALTLAPISACNDNGGEVPVINEPTLSLNETNKEISFGNVFKLIPSFSDGIKKNVIWTSSNSRVASVDSSGLVQAEGIGTAIVFAQAGNLSAKCVITVSYGSYIPALNIKHIFNDELVLTRGDSFTVDGEVLYNSKSYSADLEGYDYDDEIIDFENGIITALSVGETTLNLEAKWNDFDPTFLSKNIHIKVVEDIELYAEVTVDGVTKVSNNINLYTNRTWGNEYYSTSATINPKIYINNVYHQASFSIEDNNTLVLGGNTVTAKNPGTNIVTVYYNDTNITYFTKLNISINVPETKYLGGQLRMSIEEKFPVSTYFGYDAKLLHAYQNGRELTIQNGIFTDMEAKGDETSPLTVVTNVGSYVFEDVYAYNKILNKSNFFETMLLGGKKVIDGYYILEEDITGLDMTNQQDNSASSYFAGTFDGQLHTLDVKVGQNGVFGAFGNKAVIKNTHFNFNFIEDGIASGLARNSQVVYQSIPKVTLQNLYVTTNTYRDNTYSLMEFRNPHLILKDVFVKLTGGDLLPAFTSAYEQNQAGLFKCDMTSITGPSTFYTGDFSNVHVVTGQFMPLANYKTTSNGINWCYVSYGKNDLSHFGNEGEHYDHYVPRTNESGYAILLPSEHLGETDPIMKLFGRGNHWQIEQILHKKYLSTYSAMNSDNGVFRYDNISDMTTKKVGDWEVK